MSTPKLVPIHTMPSWLAWFIRAMLRFLGFGGTLEDVAADDSETETKAENGDLEEKPAEERLKSEPAALYLNLVILNTKEIVKKNVSERLPRRAGPVMRRVAMRAAKARITDETLARRIGMVLSERMPIKLNERGIESEAYLQYVGGPLVVVKLVVSSVDSMMLLDSNAPNAAGMARTAVSAANFFGLGGTVQNKLNVKMKASVEETIRTTLPDILTAKLQEKGLRADAFLRSAKDQAELFFQLISTLNAPGGIIPEKAVEA